MTSDDIGGPSAAGGLNRQGLAAEPGGYVRGKMRGEGTVNPIVVVVEPLYLRRIKEFPDDDGCVEMTEGQGLEFQPVAEIILPCLDAQEHILVADAVASFPV